MFFVLFVRFVDWCGVLDAPRLPGIVADVFLDALAAGPHLFARLIVVAELLLRPDLVLEGAALEAVGDGGQRPAVDALLFQRQAVAVLVVILHGGDLRKPMLFQPSVEGLDELIRVWLFSAGVGE